MAPGISMDNDKAWDDTALIASWDEALAEYKKYYSIQAQGKRLEDVLSDDELRQLRGEHGDLMEEVETRSSVLDPNGNAVHVKAEEGTEETRVKVVEGTEETNSEDQIRLDATQAKEQLASGPPRQQEASPALPLSTEGGFAAAMPQAILGNVQDESLKNLMMSWYYAGYYTGLYTGQQQAAPKDAQRKEA